MKERILNHMNEDHNEVLVLYVRYFNKRDDVKEAKLIDVNEEEMILRVNGNEDVKVKFTKRTELKDMHMEMVKMAKIVRKELGVPAPEKYKDKNHLKEEELKMEINDFVREFRSVILGTVTSEGEPNVTYAPFLRFRGDNYIFISTTGDHFDNLKNNGKLEIMFIEDEGKTKEISVRTRVRYNARAEFLQRDEQFEEIMDEFQKNNNMMKMTRTMKDFYLVKLNFIKGRYVKGVGKAYDISGNGDVTQLMRSHDYDGKHNGHDEFHGHK
ncbi:MAG: HugZ family heme oxygenase [Leptotrichiaceae bacterium]|nr:HugZ family heme oxygenase [Leptotrichiaceae bacterium]